MVKNIGKRGNVISLSILISVVLFFLFAALRLIDGITALFLLIGVGVPALFVALIFSIWSVVKTPKGIAGWLILIATLLLLTWLVLKAIDLHNNFPPIGYD